MSRRPTIAALKAGESGAWQWLMETYGDQIAGYARRMGAADPDDITGATLEGVARSIGTFSGSHRQLRSWIFSVAHARIVDDIRRRQRRPEVALVPESPDPAPEGMAAAADSGAMFDGDPVLDAALARLTDEQQTMLHLRHVTGLSTREVAAAVGKSEGATRVALHRSTRQLRDLLSDTSWLEPVGHRSVA